MTAVTPGRSRLPPGAPWIFFTTASRLSQLQGQSWSSCTAAHGLMEARSADVAFPQQGPPCLSELHQVRTVSLTFMVCCAGAGPLAGQEDARCWLCLRLHRCEERSSSSPLTGKCRRQTACICDLPYRATCQAASPARSGHFQCSVILCFSLQQNSRSGHLPHTEF